MPFTGEVCFLHPKRQGALLALAACQVTLVEGSHYIIVGDTGAACLEPQQYTRLEQAF